MSTTKELRAALRALRTRVESEALGHRKEKLLKVRDLLDEGENLLTALHYIETQREVRNDAA